MEMMIHLFCYFVTISLGSHHQKVDDDMTYGQKIRTGKVG